MKKAKLKFKLHKSIKLCIASYEDIFHVLFVFLISFTKIVSQKRVSACNICLFVCLSFLMFFFILRKCSRIIRIKLSTFSESVLSCHVIN